ncbi:MAG TPA: hypothetical protein PKJ04_09315 [Nitrospira sp.]|nr:hypothetical protein [Nitrospira sp.]MBS0176154.1 hypothetical protein [Nitrospira sp.]MBX3338707.1 hypothetical protein [Nitrospira sp.]MCW5781172.1 hypothetical protein [Nitrospira sp.]HNA26056.1 hypothetical protein [Nitrospira sp.]
MGSPVSRSHPLRQLFGALTEKSFTEHLGWPDLNVTEYLSNLLVEFAHSDQLYKIQSAQGRSVDSVVDMLFESEVLLEAHSFERERDVHRHIGDFTLFMTGLFPEYLRRLKTVSRIYHKDVLVDYVKTGKRSYGLVAEYGSYDPEQDSPLFRKLSENFELCVTGLGFVRSDLDRMQDPACRRVKDLLLN